MKVVIFALTFLAAASHAVEPYPWKAAVASEKITPTEEVWMAGYAGRKGPMESVKRDIFAKALAIEDAEANRFVFITLDLIGVPKEFRIDVEKLAEEKYQLAPGALLINASHTHSGPMLRTYRPPGSDKLLPSYSSIPEADHEMRVQQVIDYRKMLLEKIDKLFEKTLSNLQPTSITWSKARAGFAMNRRTPVGSAGWKNSPNPNAPVDHDVPVLQVKSADGKELKALLFGYACHATTLGTMEIHGDWPGYAQHFLEEDHPGAIAMFMNGASADQNPYPRRLPVFVERHGRAAAMAVEAALQTPQIPVSGPIRSAISWPEISYQTAPTRAELEKRVAEKSGYEKRYAEFLLAVLDSGNEFPKSYPVPTQVVRFGDSLTFAAIGGEVVVDYALRLKKELAEKSNGAPVWFLGYSNDVMTYIPSRRILDEGGYEGGGAMIYVRSTIHPAPWEPAIEDKLIGEIHRLFDSLE
ncbi:neutral/alkaline non-lysosomal ceramidase N-terminal domain-containing protein [Verrucomicrobiales bacterium]|nr:neutral/alkaline non-lysosomal ceramidase N-terminal domain-containing protein [Verrucomicrobiales bacterium]MDC0275915.1 neutral/alkaline non-lysosomal ceramidase N-terminal domain-containing protein [Verrucomicrobiales bacterium]MDC0322335.1 neutral/alkaline non-lysosomal ceramidase N-terminal domain-containing protein [Verrucomicrobiales bacterium]